MSVYDRLVAEHGLAESHRVVVEEVPRGARVLDVGCAGGHLAAELAAVKGCRVVGIDLDVDAARERGIEAHAVDVERDGLDATGFDVVLFADVLEHLKDPVAVLRAGRTAPLAIVSLPNIAHWTARRALLRGRFPQADHGLFDRTHVRFYTRATAHALAHESGWEVAGERFTGAPLPLESRISALSAMRGPLVARAPELFALQIVLTLRRATP